MPVTRRLPEREPCPTSARSITYQLAGRGWTFELIETGIFVLIAAALLAVTALGLTRRDA